MIHYEIHQFVFGVSGVGSSSSSNQEEGIDLLFAAEDALASTAIIIFKLIFMFFNVELSFFGVLFFWNKYYKY